MLRPFVTPNLIGCIALFLCATPALACDCTKFPFKPHPPCEDVCYAFVLNASSGDALKSVVGIPRSLTNKIDRLNEQSEEYISWDGYKQRLDAAEVNVLKRALGRLDEDKVAALWASNQTAQASMDGPDETDGETDDETEKEEASPQP